MKAPAFKLGTENLTAATLVALARQKNPALHIEPAVWQRLEDFRGAVDAFAGGEKKTYGINTGFGFLSDVKIPPEKLSQLQVNLIRSHACGVGRHLQPEVVRGLLILRAHTFLLGHSGVSRELVATVLAFLEHDILPVIPEKGSVGASGDLAPLAHLAMGLMGEGDVYFKGRLMPASGALEEARVKPFKPRAKEGLSCINGTHLMATLGAFACVDALTLFQSADVIAALSLDAIRGTLRAFDPRIHQVRRQPSQAVVAENFRKLFDGHDAIRDSHANCGKVQDPYSFRCIPQVHGAARGALEHIRGVIEGDLNSVTDNPLIFMEDAAANDVISGGNFHGEPLAMALDYLAIAAAEIANISERRIEKLTNPTQSGLPPFVTTDSGLNSGFMIPHVVAAALVSENKILCHPASVDSIPTSADKEDHVSMGPISARKAREVIDNAMHVIAIEALTAAQGIDLLAPLEPSPALQRVRAEIRKISPRVDSDRSMHHDISRVKMWLSDAKAVTASGIALR
ncbi:MAG: histidine ammonia-lyase [Proteobacteria bacterium]|nr:histidine ammonia-lyase [Pseudomonadota bacterium]